ncbi:hypothetical protein [Rhizobium johnstonii]
MQLEADKVVRLLGLDDLLSEVDSPTRVGSSAMGLMVRRDINITVVCDRLDDIALQAFADIGARLMQKTEYVEAVRFRNDTGLGTPRPRNIPTGFIFGSRNRRRTAAVPQSDAIGGRKVRPGDRTAVRGDLQRATITELGRRGSGVCVIYERLWPGARRGPS